MTEPCPTCGGIREARTPAGEPGVLTPCPDPFHTPDPDPLLLDKGERWTKEKTVCCDRCGPIGRAKWITLANGEVGAVHDDTVGVKTAERLGRPELAGTLCGEPAGWVDVVPLAALHQVKVQRDEARAALEDAIRIVARGRIGTIGPHRVYTPQVDVRAVERWRAASNHLRGVIEMESE